MNSRILLIFGFVLLCSAQLYFPAKVVLQNEGILDSGTAWKFKCRPIDPNDPFRGKYITLAFEAGTFKTLDSTEYESKEPVYALLEKDSLGYAKVSNISREAPVNPDYLSASVLSTRKTNWNNENSDYTVRLELPFNRYYMEESKAKPAEDAYRDARRDEETDVYALVKVKDGTAVLENVFINDQPIKEYVESYYYNETTE